MSRAIRRHQKEKKRKYAERLVLETWRYRTPSLLIDMIHNCDNLKMCRRDCCKNPRRSGWSKASGKTARELQDDVKEQAHESV